MSPQERARLGGLAFRKKHATGRAKEWVGKELQRNVRIAFLRDSGATLQQIGDEFGLSKERVRQIIEAAA